MGETIEILPFIGRLERFRPKDDNKKGTVLSKTKYRAMLLLFFVSSTKGALTISS